jgi:hypothetical protein
MMERLRYWLEVFGGARPAPGPRAPLRSLAIGVWWFVLFLVVFATIGGATKFIYVDF